MEERENEDRNEETENEVNEQGIGKRVIGEKEGTNFSYFLAPPSFLCFVCLFVFVCFQRQTICLCDGPLLFLLTK